ncbi:MAG: Rid family detoxifying hydrolase [Planctomycetota bacterium]
MRLSSVAVLVLVMLAGCAGNHRQTHTTDALYPAIGPYSQMVQSGNLYFLSGVIPLNRAGTAVQGTTIEEQTRVVLDYIGAALAAQGLRHQNVVTATVYLKDLGDFAAMNGIYSQYFAKDPPARATVEVARLPKDVRIEIAVTAAR